MALNVNHPPYSPDLAAIATTDCVQEHFPDEAMWSMSKYKSPCIIFFAVQNVLKYLFQCSTYRPHNSLTVCHRGMSKFYFNQDHECLNFHQNLICVKSVII